MKTLSIFAIVAFCMIGCERTVAVPEATSVRYENHFAAASVPVTGPLADHIIATLNDGPDSADKNARMALDSRKYLHVGARTFQVTGSSLVLLDDWGVRIWSIDRIETTLDALIPRTLSDPHAKDATHPPEVARLMKLLPEIPARASLDDVLALLGLRNDWTLGSVSATHCHMGWEIAPGYRFWMFFDPKLKDEGLALEFTGAEFEAQNTPGAQPHVYHTIYPYRALEGMVSTPGGDPVTPSGPE